MENNLFDFATSELSQDAFLCWCLNWYNYREATLYPMAKDVLALLGVTVSKQDKKLIIHRQFYKIDILVVLPAQNLAVIIEDKTFTSEHDNQIDHYKKTLQALPAEERKEPKIHTVFFKTGFHYDRDKATVADNKVDGQAFLAVLEKYKKKARFWTITSTICRETSSGMRNTANMMIRKMTIFGNGISPVGISHSTISCGICCAENTRKPNGNLAVTCTKSTVEQIEADVPGRNFRLRSRNIWTAKITILCFGG